MPELSFLLIISLIGITAGFFDSLIGAGGLISVPLLVFLGLPPHVAIATDRFGTIGQIIAALIKFKKAKKILWKYVPALSLLALVGSLIGANILLNIDSNILQYVIGVLILIIFPFVLFKSDIGIKSIKVSKTKIAIGLFLYLIIMIFGGFFGQGTGPLIFYTLTYFLGLTMVEVLATGIIPWLVLSLSSLIIFAYNGIIDYKVGIILLITMSIGGYVGAHTAVSKGDKWIKNIFIIFVVISAVKLLFF